MSRQGRNTQSELLLAGPSEPESHIEHRAALDATLFRPANDPGEVVLELEAGRLLIRAPSDS